MVVEIWSPSQLTSKGLNKEGIAKIKLYQQAGVKIIWSINPDKQTVIVYHANQIKPLAELGLDDELDGDSLIPNFKLSVQKLFE